MVDGVDDLGVLDALKVDGRNAEVGMPELPLDHDERDALAGHFDSVGMAELVRCEATLDAAARGPRPPTRGDRDSVRG